VARLGGDEFAILLEGIGSDLDVERVATPISAAFNRPLLLDGREIEATASIGVACSQPGDDAEQLLRNADIAMYGAKAAGKARLVVFQPHMQEQLHDRLRLEQDIDLGLARDEFFLEFQPVVDLTSRELLGVEALLRWNHPRRGVVMPADFIPDRRGIGPDRRGRSPGPGRSVHAGASLQRLDPGRDGPARGRQHLRPTPATGEPGRGRAQRTRDLGLEPGSLVIELTESTIMQNTEVNLERFRELKALGSGSPSTTSAWATRPCPTCTVSPSTS